MVLHTWGQTMNDHPHVRCIVTGDVLKNDGSAFVRAPKNFLFPVTALSPVFREKFIAALQALKDKGKLDLRGQPERESDAGWQRFLAKQGIDYGLCPRCGEGKLRNIYRLLSFHDPPECFLQAA
jgi:hypothetical protein